MLIPWSDHLDLARYLDLIREDDLGEPTTAMGRCLFHLQQDLRLDTWGAHGGSTNKQKLRKATGSSIAIATKAGLYKSSLERKAKDLVDTKKAHS